ncbi:MAG: hypothetical protein NXI04_15220 [Planctomycetaceae bacterium]|nr:hypothetical protein [Planctomycetaceae bacterium]
MSESAPPALEKTVSGSKLVVAMFTMAIVATSLLWFYWDLHLMPYMPLQEALASEFDDSSPRVDGGQRKMHKGTPLILRVVMRVPFDPTLPDEQTQGQIERRLERTKELAGEYTEIDRFETLEVHLYFQPKEKTLKQKTFSKSLRDKDGPGADDLSQDETSAPSPDSSEQASGETPAGQP